MEAAEDVDGPHGPGEHTKEEQDEDTILSPHESSEGGDPKAPGVQTPPKKAAVAQKQADRLAFDSDDSSDGPKYPYERMTVEERIAVARTSGVDDAEIQRHMELLQLEADARVRDLKENYQPSITASPMRHQARAMAKDKDKSQL